MSNLLDKSSIVLTASAYDNGKALCVKPSDGSGDMDFSRNSAATRVNAQGLVEDVQILSSNLVQNGDFSNGSTDWVLGTGWSIGDDKAIYDGTGGTSQIRQDGVVVIGKKYKLTLDVLANEGNGNNTIFLGGLQINTIHLNVGSYTFVGTTTSNASVNIYGRTGEVFEISNISIIEITDDTNLPRISYENFSYDGSGNIIPDSGCGSWLFEPQSTNLITYSEDFSQWPVINSIILVNNIVSPEGILNASRITATSTGDAAFVRNSQATQATTTTYSFSCFVKKGTTNFVRLANRALGSVSIASAWFDIENGVIGTLGSGLSSSKIEDFGNGWYRCIAIGTTGGTIPNQLIDIAASTTDGATGVSIGDFIYLFGAQLEEQSYSTSYIPSNGTQTTRNQDVCTNGGSVSTINSTEGVLYFEGSALSASGSAGLISLSDGTNSNRLTLELDGANVKGGFIAGGVSVGIFNYATDITLDTKIAFKYKVNDFSLWVNGAERVTINSGSVPSIGTLSELSFDRADGAENFFGKTKALAVWKEDLSDEELAELTTI